MFQKYQSNDPHWRSIFAKIQKMPEINFNLIQRHFFKSYSERYFKNIRAVTFILEVHFQEGGGGSKFPEKNVQKLYFLGENTICGKNNSTFC